MCAPFSLLAAEWWCRVALKRSCGNIGSNSAYRPPEDTWIQFVSDLQPLSSDNRRI